MRTPHFDVIVGNVGTVYSGTDRDKAERTHAHYARLAQTQQGGRCYGETVTTMKDGEIYEETES